MSTRARAADARGVTRLHATVGVLVPLTLLAGVLAASPWAGTRLAAATPTTSPSGGVAPRVPATSSSPAPVRQADPTTDPPDDPGHLTAAMQRRVARAIAGARAAGVVLTVTSGWRSAQKQEELLQAAVAKYGSLAAATRWVLPPADSAHVRGLAVDVGPSTAAHWLDENGATFGLCRRYDNEPWHFEPLTRPGGTCPPREPHPVPR